MGPALLEGAVHTRAFETYVEHVLAPARAPGQIAVLDNRSAHKSERTHALIAYSPDLSPSEEAFTELKALLCRAADAQGFFASTL
jgi:hypothetical protein